MFIRQFFNFTFTTKITSKMFPTLSTEEVQEIQKLWTRQYQDLKFNNKISTLTIADLVDILNEPGSQPHEAKICDPWFLDQLATLIEVSLDETLSFSKREKNEKKLTKKMGVVLQNGR